MRLPPIPPARAPKRPGKPREESHFNLAGTRRGIASTLLCLNLFVGLIIALSLWNYRDHENEHAAETVENFNHVLGGDLEGLFSKIDFCLEGIVDEFSEENARGGWQGGRLQSVIDREANRLMGTAGIRIVNQDGDLVLASNERILSRLNMADRERFRVLRADPNAGLVVAKPEKEGPGDEWTVAFARRLHNADGSFAGEVHIAVRTAQIEQMFSGLRLGPHGVVSLWNSTPATIARFPALPPAIAGAPPPPPSTPLRRLFESHASQGAYAAKSGTDGVARRYYFQKLPNFPLYMIVGVAEADYLAEWYAHAVQFALLYILLVAVSCAGGIVFYSRAAARQSAAEQSRLAALVYDNSAEAMIVLDDNGSVLGVNNAFLDITGFARSEVEGRAFLDLPARPGNRMALRRIVSALRAEGRWNGEVWSLTSSGETFLARVSVSAIRDDLLGLRRIVALFSDVTEQKKTQEAIWRHANFDALTSLPNRRMFRERLEEEIFRARKSGLRLAVVFIDLDRFKDINDSLGHQLGDLLLQEAATRVRARVRASDMVARLGGDEFTVVMSDVRDIESAERMAASIVESLAAPYQLAGELRFVSASLGVTLFPDDAVGGDDLVRNADLAMYEAKKAGRNKHLFFDPAMQKATTARAAIANDLHHALEERQFELHYQPIVDLKTGLVGKAEALIRWRHPTRGLVGPSEFISIAEETGIIADVGEWVFHEAARQAAVWRDRWGPALSVSVNVSPTQFVRAAEKLEAFPELARSFALGDGGLIVEITEGVLLDASETVKSLLVRLRDAGVQIALDDFGTGYSSLAYLKQFDINFLKIDRAFVRGLAEQTSDLAICEAVIAMAHRLGISVVAEGIETDAQRMLLAASRCDFGQGYLFARPMAAEAFEKTYLMTRLPRRDAGDRREAVS